MAEKPKVQGEAAHKEIEKINEQFQEQDKLLKGLNMDAMNKAPVLEIEPHHHMSSREQHNAQRIVLKPHKVISGRDKFNEKFRDEYTYKNEMVQFIAQNNEVKGETIDIWTKPFAGVPAMEWLVPVNKPVWGPRYLAEQIKRKQYHRIVSNERRITAEDGNGTYVGYMEAKHTINRLDAMPVSSGKSIFMGQIDSK